MSRFSSSPIVAAFAAARSENQDDIYLVVQEVAEQIRAFEAAEDSQETVLFEGGDNAPAEDNGKLSQERSLQFSSFNLLIDFEGMVSKFTSLQLRVLVWDPISFLLVNGLRRVVRVRSIVNPSCQLCFLHLYILQ